MIFTIISLKKLQKNLQQSFANPTKKYKKCSRRSIYQISKMGKTVFCWKKHDTNNQWHYQRHWKNCIRKNKVWEKIIVDVEFVDIYLKRFSLESHHHLIRSIMYCTFFLDSGLVASQEKKPPIFYQYIFFTQGSQLVCLLLSVSKDCTIHCC